jgi:putative hydrolase of the HAD superfamily
MIKAVFFDVEGTLITPFPSVGHIYSEIAERHGVFLSPEILQERFKSSWTKFSFNRERIDKEWWDKIVHDIFEDTKFNNFDSFFEDLYQSFIEDRRWRIYSDVHPTLDRLKVMGLRLAVASNWDDRLPGLLTQLGLTHYFEQQFISFQIGYLKPAPEFFAYAIQSMKLHPEEILFIGDDEITDIQGGEKAGIKSYLINRRDKPVQCRSLRNLGDILLKV